jgi:hypothetical protein
VQPHKAEDCKPATVGTVFANLEGKKRYPDLAAGPSERVSSKSKKPGIRKRQAVQVIAPPTVPLLLTLRLLSDIPVGRYKHLIIRLLTPQCKSQHAMACASPQQSCRSLADLALFQPPLESLA